MNNSLLPKLPVLTAKATKLVSLFAAQDIGSLAVIPFRLPDPGVNRRNARLELTRELLNAPPSSMQFDDLLPESRRVRIPCSWHLNTFPLQAKGLHETGGTPTPVVDLQTAINRFIAEHNHAEAKPFTWRVDPDEIIAERKRGFQTLESIH